jgi:hypothetical protein
MNEIKQVHDLIEEYKKKESLLSGIEVTTTALGCITYKFYITYDFCREGLQEFKKALVSLGVSYVFCFSVAPLTGEPLN